MSENEKYTIVVKSNRVEVSEAVYRAYHKERESERYQKKLIYQFELSLERFQDEGVNVEFLITRFQQSINNLQTPDNYKDLTVGKPLNIKLIVEAQPRVEKIVEEKEQSKLDQVIDLITKLSEGQREILSNQVDMKEKLDKISEQIEKLSGQISIYQSLVSRQLDNADSEDEKEKIISIFTDELIDQIKDSFRDGYDLKEYQAEETLLKDLFQSAWDKMDDNTHKFLVSAKIMYKKQVALGDLIDYSGVCVLVTKALEAEMDKRFFTLFKNYMKANYPGRANHSQFPTSLLNQYGHPKRQKDYTLGSVPFTLCYKTDDIDPDKQVNDKAKLLEFCHAELFTGKSDAEIMDLLLDYGEEIENIKNDYRNPSAHINQLQRVNAQECIDLVIDVQKLLKRMLDSFNQ